jgi:formate hydrogenlyase subunit 3/multisubunit Na+/H+ antiporter MnhD subunit
MQEIINSILSSFDFKIGEAVLWAIWIIIFIVAVVFAVIFFYHWKKYDWEDKKVRIGAWIFIVGVTILLLASGFTVFYIF